MMISYWNGLRIGALLALALLAVAECSRPARATTLYWDTDGSTAGNNASTGANLGGSGPWSAADANWWSTSIGTLQVWTDGSDAVFWGTAGTVTLSAASANTPRPESESSTSWNAVNTVFR